MKFAPGPDPRYSELYETDKSESRGRTLSRPADSHHLWAGTIAGDLPRGTHWLWVRSTDPFGRQDTAAHPVRVRADGSRPVSDAGLGE